MALGGVFVYVIPIVWGVGIKMTNAQGYICNVTSSRGYICFFVGIILGFFFSFSDKMKRKNRSILIAACVVELVIMVFFASIPHYDYVAIVDYNLYASFMLFPELLYVCYNLKWLNKLCNNRLIKFGGKISFDIYVWNFPILITLFAIDNLANLSWNVQSKWYWIALVIIHIVVGIISYELIEKRMPGKIRKFFEVETE